MNKQNTAVIDDWIREHTRRYGFKVNKNTEPDIIAKLESVDNIQGYIKALIRADIKKGEE